MPKIRLKNVRERARGVSGQEATWPKSCGSRGPHSQRASLAPCGPRSPMGWGDVATLDWPIFPFSTIFQSCVVVIVRKIVIVRNPKTNSKSEFRCPRYG